MQTVRFLGLARFDRATAALRNAGFVEDELRRDALVLQASMVYRLTPQHSAPPLPAMLTPGKGADLRIRTWLWLLVMGHGRARAGGKARFDLPSLRALPCIPSGTDPRRCSRTFDCLVEARRLSSRGDLYRETAQYGGEFDWEVADLKRPHYTREWAERVPDPLTCFEMPLAVWANGWIDRLEPATICALFAVRHMCPESGVWYRVPRVIKDRYALSSKLWNRGLLALYNCGLVDVVQNGAEVPQRWIRPDWDKLSRPPLSRRRRRYRVIEDPSLLKARTPRTPARTSVVGEKIRQEREQLKRQIGAAYRAGDEATLLRLAEIVRCFTGGHELDAGRVTRTLHAPREVGRERSYVSAALDVLVQLGVLVAVDPPDHHAVPIRRYRLAEAMGSSMRSA